MITGTEPQTAKAERRASVRYPCDPDSFSPDNSCRPITTSQKDSWLATVRNLSTGGIGLVVARRFELGTLLQVDLEDANHTARSSFLVRVVHIAAGEGKAWLLGCAFTSKLTESDLLSLM
jgi:hypothetical protein